MEFPGFLGNDQLKASLSAAVDRQRAAHFYLLSGPRGAGKRTLARLLAAALLCQDSHRRPCGQCGSCRKVLAGFHPDLIPVDDPDKKTVSVETVRQAREDLFIRPNEGERKIYYVPRAQDLGLPGQNALLKVLEEPPPYGVFLLLADNPDRLLPTVRSRCVELRLQPLEESQLAEALRQAFPQASQEALASAIWRSGGWLGQAKELLQEGRWLPQTESFAQAYSRRNHLQLLQILTPMEKLKRDQLVPILSQGPPVCGAHLQGGPSRTGPFGQDPGVRPHFPGAVPGCDGSGSRLGLPPGQWIARRRLRGFALATPVKFSM